MKKQMSKLYDNYLYLKETDDKTLYLFKSGIFFIFLADDAKIASKLLNLKITYFTEDVIKCGFPVSSLEKYTNILKRSPYNFKIVDNIKNTIYSIHNYVPMCVTGFYYMRHKHCNCNPKHTGEDCIKCTRKLCGNNFAVEQYKRGIWGQDPQKCISQKRWINELGFQELDEDVSEEHILDFAKTATQKINKNWLSKFQ